MEGHIVATYTLIYGFLKQQSQSKAAEAVKKAAKDIVVLRDDIEPEGTALEDIVRKWKQSKKDTESNDESSSEESDSSDEETSSESDDSSSADSSSEDTSDSESEDDDTSDDDDDDSSDDSDEESPAKKSPQKPVERDTSVTLSSSSAGEKVVADQSAKTVAVKATEDNDEDAESDSFASDSSDSDSSSQSAASDNSNAKSSSNSSDSSSSSSESSDEETEKPTQQPSANKSRGKRPSESSSSESSDGEEEKTATRPPPGKPEGKRPSPSESSSSESSSESEDESDPEPEQKVDEHIAKKRKISESGAPMAVAYPPSTLQFAAQQKNEKPPPKFKERFQRVKVQNMASDMLLNNGYEARGGASNDYGERAHRDLIVTRGAGFRKEKNKKKRGSYRGGEITMENHSIKFDF